MLDNFVAPYDATAVARLDAAGAVMLGKTNMDEFAMGSSCETSFYGPMRNPWDADACAGRIVGWFGGGARGGSHAGCNRHRHRRVDPPTGGVQGHLRTQTDIRRVSRYGMVAFASSLDQGGPMARSVVDVALLYRRHGGLRPQRLDQRSARPRRSGNGGSRFATETDDDRFAERISGDAH